MRPFLRGLLYFVIVTNPALLASLGHAQSPAPSDRLYIDVGQANLKRSLMALPPFQFLGTPAVSKNYLKVGKDLFDTVSNDLSVSSYFEFIRQDALNAFPDEMAKTSLRPSNVQPGGFNMAVWEQMGAEFLVRAGYSIAGGELTMETYVYHTRRPGKLVLGKTYKASVNDARFVAHTFCNDIIKELTGKRGIFLTKLVASRSTKPQQKEIFVMDWDGSNPKQISNHKSIAISPTWSPDGKSIAYTAYTLHVQGKGQTRNADLLSYELTSGRRWLVSYTKGINSGASFTPDGKSILLTISGGGNPDLYRMTVEGKNQVKLTDGPRGAMNVEPSMSPDGTKIAFSSDRSGKPMIYIMDANGSNIKRVTFAGDYNSTPSWSPDGKKVAFAGYDKGHFDLFVMDADGTNMIRLTSAKKPSGRGADNEDPTFSPDGRHILFVSNRTGTNQLYIVNVDGENERRITFDKNEYFKPRWSPYID